MKRDAVTVVRLFKLNGHDKRDVSMWFAKLADTQQVHLQVFWGPLTPKENLFSPPMGPSCVSFQSQVHLIAQSLGHKGVYSVQGRHQIALVVWDSHPLNLCFL